jgi:hypothetical protein
MSVRFGSSKMSVRFGSSKMSVSFGLSKMSSGLRLQTVTDLTAQHAGFSFKCQTLQKNLHLVSLCSTDQLPTYTA